MGKGGGQSDDGVRSPRLSSPTSWAASHTVLTLSELPFCMLIGVKRDRALLRRLPGGNYRGSSRQVLRCVFFPFWPHLSGSSGSAKMQKQVPAGRSQASEMPSEFQPHEMGQSHFQERARCMDSFPGGAASRNL